MYIHSVLVMIVVVLIVVDQKDDLLDVLIVTRMEIVQHVVQQVIIYRRHNVTVKRMTVEHVLHTTNAPAMCVVGPIVVEQRADRQAALTVTLAVIVTHAVPGTTR